MLSQFNLDSHLPGPSQTKEIRDLLQEDMIILEGYYHGKTTGVDIKTILHGGCNYLSNEGFHSLNGHKINSILIISTENEGNTKEAVSKFGEYLLSDPDARKKKITRMGQITSRIKDLIQEKDFQEESEFNELIEENQAILKEFGVSSENSEKIVLQF